ALADARGASVRSRAPALERRPRVHVRAVDDQVLRNHPRNLLRVGDRGVQALLHGPGGGGRGEPTDAARLLDLTPADEVDHPPRLRRRDAHELDRRLGFHRYLTELLRSDRACERKVRVGANSPSLCPTMDSEM